MAKKGSGNLQLKKFADLAEVRKNPEMILKILEPTEFEIVRILFNSQSGLSANAVYSSILSEKVRKAIEGEYSIMLWDAPLDKIANTPQELGRSLEKQRQQKAVFLSTLKHHSQNTKQFVEEISELEKRLGRGGDPEPIPIILFYQSCLRSIQKMKFLASAFGVDVPAHTTITRNLKHLLEVGVVGRWGYKDRKSSGVYFLNFKLHGILKTEGQISNLVIRLPASQPL